jgi:hypothetical protein
VTSEVSQWVKGLSPDFFYMGTEVMVYHWNNNVSIALAVV